MPAVVVLRTSISEVITAPVIREEIGGGRVQISGRMNTREANDVALLMRAGALAARRNEDAIARNARDLKKSILRRLFTHGLRGEPLKETEIGLVPQSWEVVPLGEIVAREELGDRHFAGEFEHVEKTHLREPVSVADHLGERLRKSGDQVSLWGLVHRSYSTSELENVPEIDLLEDEVAV